MRFSGGESSLATYVDIFPDLDRSGLNGAT